MSNTTTAVQQALRQHSLWPGLASGLISAAALLWRGQQELKRPLAPINAPSHWFWGDPALRQSDASVRFTAVGALTHQASSMMWAALYDALQRSRRRRTPANAVVDALAVTGVAACVDLAVVPRRLTPGFQEHLSRRGLGWVYAGFAAGLALGGVMAQRRG